jgi:hypothetical protein
MLNLQVFGALFQYTDQAGTQHIVSDADQIPPRYRKSVQVLDDEGQILGKLQKQPQNSPDDRARLEALKNRGRGQKKVDDATARRLLEQLLEPEEEEEGIKESAKKSAPKASQNREPLPNVPEGSPGWMLLAVALVLGVIALRMLQGILRITALMCALIALMMFVGEEFGETPLGSKVKVATERIVAPLKKASQAAGDKVGSPLKAPYEAINKVRNALDTHKEASEERNAILDQLSESD